MWKYGARLDWTTVIVDTRDANAHSPIPCKFQWFDDCAIATMFFFFSNCFYFSCFICYFLSWIFLVAITKTYSIPTNHRCVRKIQWQRSWSVSHRLFHRQFFIHCNDVCVSMAALCNDDAQTIINNQWNFAFSLVKFRNHLSMHHHMKNTYWHCYFHFVLRQSVGFNGVKKQMKLK